MHKMRLRLKVLNKQQLNYVFTSLKSEILQILKLVPGKEILVFDLLVYRYLEAMRILWIQTPCLSEGSFIISCKICSFMLYRNERLKKKSYFLRTLFYAPLFSYVPTFNRSSRSQDCDYITIKLYCIHFFKTRIASNLNSFEKKPEQLVSLSENNRKSWKSHCKLYLLYKCFQTLAKNVWSIPRQRLLLLHLKDIIRASIARTQGLSDKVVISYHFL